jgi:chemotaxis protein MotD
VKQAERAEEPKAPRAEPKPNATPAADSATAAKPGVDALQNPTNGTPAGIHAAITAAHAGNATAVAAPASGAPAAAAPAAAVPLAGVAVEIATQALAGKNRFEIRLDPPELGRIDVRLDIDREGHVTSRLMVERAETLDLLRRDSSQLERALQQAGLKTADNGLEFSLRDQAFSRDERPSQNPARVFVPDQEAPALEAARHGYRRLSASGGIDIRV